MNLVSGLALMAERPTSKSELAGVGILKRGGGGGGLRYVFVPRSWHMHLTYFFIIKSSHVVRAHRRYQASKRAKIFWVEGGVKG